MPGLISGMTMEMAAIPPMVNSRQKRRGAFTLAAVNPARCARDYNTSSSAWQGIFGKMTPQQVDLIATQVFSELKTNP